MGTRHITAIIKDGEYKVSQYGQFDGYPEYTGKVIYDFLTTPGNIERLRVGVDNVREITSDELKAVYDNIGSQNEWLTMEESDMFEKLYPHLHRNTGAGILELIAKSTGPLPLVIDTEFMHDEWCEFIYIIDLDVNRLFIDINGRSNTIGVFKINALPPLEEFMAELGVQVEQI